ncbi:MAG TPA: HDOD domain-containing protein [bacterium]|nr:HDOD domain-containing protein [bacterium]HOL48250.1 HDOD domain-containing protein [bacterium]HPQ19369.1 HDOD domain-containing protein [bacterium]
MDLEKIEKILARIDTVPTLSVVATKLATVLQDKKSSAQEVANIIKNDQALTSKVLKLVNSAYYGFSQKISTIRHATTILGFNMLTSIALSITIFDTLKLGKEKEIFNPEEFWKHSIGVAICSRLLAEKLLLKESETIFVAGLIHDIGKIIEEQYLREEFLQIIEILKQEKISILEAEKRVMGIDHTYIGSVVANSWQLPPILIDTIKFHHFYSPSLNSKPQHLISTAIVHFADILVKTQLFGFSGDNIIPSLIKEYWLALNIKKEEVENIIKQLPDELNKSLEMLDIIL